MGSLTRVRRGSTALFASRLAQPGRKWPLRRFPCHFPELAPLCFPPKRVTDSSKTLRLREPRLPEAKSTPALAEGQPLPLERVNVTELGVLYLVRGQK